MLVITEKQYESIDILLGRLTEADEPFQSEQLSFFETNTSEILASVLFFCKAKPLEALPSSGFADSLLYHTKNYQGTITL